jgi:hypothetical protein
MKKIYLILFLISTSLSSIFGQLNLQVIAPPGNGATTQSRGPNGTANHMFMRGCFLVTQAELTSLVTGTNVTSFGFSLTTGVTGSPVTGSITVYLQNTSDVSYLKGTTFATALTGMSNVYNSTMTIPVSTGSAAINLTLAPTFTYTGGGIYVAYDWVSAGPFSTGIATYAADNSMSIGGATAASSIAPAPATLGNTSFRPCFIFKALNSATNDVQVTGIIASGKVAGSFNAPNTISAIIKNGSNGALTNIGVNLNIGGANTFANTLTISTLAAGSSTSVSFAAFTPTMGGLNTISVSTLPDQNNANNLSVYNQSVTCDTWGQKEPNTTFNSAVGFNTSSGIIASKFVNPITSTLTAINLAIGSATQNAGNSVYAVLMDAGGNITALTNTITITAPMYGQYQSFTLTPQVLPPGTYYLGIAQPSNATLGYFPLGASSSSFMPTTIYFTANLTGGFVFPSSTNLGYFGIDGVFAQTATISATSPATVVCDNASITLTANGANTYTWSTGPTTQTAAVSPTVASTYTVVGTDIFGCTANASVSLAVNPSPTVTAITNSTSVCPGSSVSLTANGALTYTWSTGATTTVTAANPTVATTYSVVGTNTFGCNSTGTVAVGMNTPTITITSPTAICLGNSAVISANGASSYTWSTGSIALNIVVSPTTTASYSVTGTNSVGCVGTKTLSLIVNPNPTVTAVANPTVICAGQTSTITANGAASYSWNTTSTVSAIVVSPSVTANYTVVGTNSVGCTNSLVVTQNVNACLGIHENTGNTAFMSVYPNPSTGVFIIELDNTTATNSIEIYDLLGSKIKSQKVNSEKTEINLQDQKNGVYFIYLIENNKKVNVSKIVKQ